MLEGKDVLNGILAKDHEIQYTPKVKTLGEVRQDRGGTWPPSLDAALVWTTREPFPPCMLSLFSKFSSVNSYQIFILKIGKLHHLR